MQNLEEPTHHGIIDHHPLQNHCQALLPTALKPDKKLAAKLTVQDHYQSRRLGMSSLPAPAPQQHQLGVTNTATAGLSQEVLRGVRSIVHKLQWLRTLTSVRKPVHSSCTLLCCMFCSLESSTTVSAANSRLWRILCRVQIQS